MTFKNLFFMDSLHLSNKIKNKIKSKILHFENFAVNYFNIYSKTKTSVNPLIIRFFCPKILYTGYQNLDFTKKMLQIFGFYYIKINFVYRISRV